MNGYTIFLIMKAVIEMLSLKELIQLEDDIKEELNENLGHILSLLNRTGQLDTLLKLLGLEKLIVYDNGYRPYESRRIIVIGETKLKPEVFYAIGKSLGIKKDRFELYLEYKDAKRFDFSKTQYKPEYALIMVGPMPHSGVSKGDSSGIITALEQGNNSYPPVVRLGSNGLKITKSNFAKDFKKR